MIGSTISHFKIIDKLGEGGMGVVYRAHDTKLERDVALKFLPPHLSASEQDKARFIQEAKAAATLDHPNICTVYSIEEHEGRLFIAMQFVDGQLLRDQMSGMTQKTALETGIQIAEGLAAAHEKGVVHRDIKPENIMIRKDGMVQIMDFGLAKLKGVSRLTKEGSTVGTAGYMSPEQIQGQDADHRSDIFSLGVLLYEMLTGQLPFRGVHETAMAYEIVNVDPPPMATLKPDVDPAVDAIVLDCLEKNPKERTQAAGQVALELRRCLQGSGRQRASRIVKTQTSALSGEHRAPVEKRRMGWLPWAMTGVVTALFAGWLLLHPGATGSDTEVRRLNVSAINQAGQQIFRLDVPTLVASPDGRFLVYTLTESGASQLYLRSLSSFDATVIKGTENAVGPFISPDGQWIGFASDGKLKKIPVTGGAVEVLCDAPGFRGAAWLPDGRIVFGPSYAASLMIVPASGGQPEPFSKLDSSAFERTHRWPQATPDGKWVLYTIGDERSPNSYLDARLVMQSVDTGERHLLDVRGEMASYVNPGYLIVARNGSLLAAPFNMEEFRVTRPLTAVVNDVGGDPGSGVAYFTVSRNGHLFFLSGSKNQDLDLVWVNRQGTVTPLTLPPQPYTGPRISPDGTRIAVTLGLVSANNSDIWIYDLKTAAFNRFTFTQRDFAPIWSRNGKELYYSSGVTGKGVMAKSADGSSPAKVLLAKSGPIFPIAVSPDEHEITLNTATGASEGDLYLLDTRGGKDLMTILDTPDYEYGGAISPDGRYLLYGSGETGRLEVYISTYPDLKGKWQISENGGLSPIWSPNGREVFYVSTVGKMMSVSLERNGTLRPGKPRELFDASQMLFPNSPITNYDVAPDGQKFIMVRSVRSAAGITAFNVILNWTGELQSHIGVSD